MALMAMTNLLQFEWWDFFSIVNIDLKSGTYYDIKIIVILYPDWGLGSL